MKLFTKLERGEIRRIEGFQRYAITPEGSVINISRVKTLRPFTNGHRLAVGLTSDTGRKTTISLARLIATHFIDRPEDDQYYDVVFKDGNHANVHPSNLEWKPRWMIHADPRNYDLDIT